MAFIEIQNITKSYRSDAAVRHVLAHSGVVAAVGGGGITDVTLNGQHADVFRGLDGASVRYYRVAEFPVCGDERLSDSLRGPGDDGNLLDRVRHDGGRSGAG